MPDEDPLDRAVTKMELRLRSLSPWQQQQRQQSRQRAHRLLLLTAGIGLATALIAALTLPAHHASSPRPWWSNFLLLGITLAMAANAVSMRALGKRTRTRSEVFGADNEISQRIIKESLKHGRATPTPDLALAALDTIARWRAWRSHELIFSMLMAIWLAWDAAFDNHPPVTVLAAAVALCAFVFTVLSSLITGKRYSRSEQANEQLIERELGDQSS